MLQVKKSDAYTLLASISCTVVLLAGCATSTPSTYAEWKAKQEVKAQSSRMLEAAKDVVFKPAHVN
jgi:hypothetical protein